MDYMNRFQEAFVKEHDLLLKVAAGQLAAIPFIANFLNYTEVGVNYLAVLWMIIFALVLFTFLLLGKFFWKDIFVPLAGVSMLVALVVITGILGYVTVTVAAPLVS